jgi:hypothetical protein
VREKKELLPLTGLKWFLLVSFLTTPKYADTVRDAKSVFGSWAPMLLLFKKWKIIYIFVLKNLKIKSGHSK